MSIKPHVNGHSNGVDNSHVDVDRHLESTLHLTDRARRAIIHGEEEAWQRGVRNVRTEHLLLGMIRERDNVAAVILRRMRIDLDLVKAAVENAILPADSRYDNPLSGGEGRGEVEEGPGEVDSGCSLSGGEGWGEVGSDDFPDAAAAACIELAGDEARELSNNYIGTEHLLLGLIREERGLGGRILREAGITLVDARREVSLLQHGERGLAVMKEPETNVPYHTEVIAATRLASLLGHAHVTPVHLTVVLLSDPSETVSRLLGQFGVDPAALLAQFPEADATTPAGHPTHPSMSYAAGHVLSRATEKAWGMFHQEIPGREHLLLALLEDPEAAGTVLRASGLEPYAALLELLRLREKGV